MLRCTFTGHRDVIRITVADILKILEEIMLQSDEDMECLVGGMGDFDGLAASAVRSLKRKYKNRKIRLVLVMPYMQKKVNDQKAYYEEMYDEIIVPAELDGVHYKRAITLRNRWMVDQSKYVIAMVWRDYGGAYDTLKYARKQKKKIIELSSI